MIFMADFGLLMEFSCLLFFVNPEQVDSRREILYCRVSEKIKACLSSLVIRQVKVLGQLAYLAQTA